MRTERQAGANGLRLHYSEMLEGVFVLSRDYKSKKRERLHGSAVRREQTKRIASNSFFLVAVVLTQVAIGYVVAQFVS